MESRTTAEHIQHCGKLLKTKQQKHQDLLRYILKKKRELFSDSSEMAALQET